MSVIELAVTFSIICWLRPPLSFCTFLCTSPLLSHRFLSPHFSWKMLPQTEMYTKMKTCNRKDRKMPDVFKCLCLPAYRIPIMGRSTVLLHLTLSYQILMTGVESQEVPSLTGISTEQRYRCVPKMEFLLPVSRNLPLALLFQRMTQNSCCIKFCLGHSLSSTSTRFVRVQAAPTHKQDHCAREKIRYSNAHVPSSSSSSSFWRQNSNYNKVMTGHMCPQFHTNLHTHTRTHTLLGFWPQCNWQQMVHCPGTWSFSHEEHLTEKKQHSPGMFQYRCVWDRFSRAQPGDLGRVFQWTLCTHKNRHSVSWGSVLGGFHELWISYWIFRTKLFIITEYANDVLITVVAWGQAKPNCHSSTQQ